MNSCNNARSEVKKMKEKLSRISILLLLLLTVITSAVHFAPLSFAYPGTNFYVDPPKVEKFTNTTSVGSTFKVYLKFGNMTELAGIEYKLYWRKDVLNFTDIHDTLPWPSYYLAKNETTNNYNETHGRMWFTAVDTSGTPFTGSGTLREITFKILNAPASAYGSYLYTLIDIQDDIFGDSSANAIPHDTYDGEFFYIRPGPVAAFTYSPAQPRVNEPVTFNASSSYVAGGGTITQYSWNFGDGNKTNSAAPIITHAYTSAGNFTVTLNVTDNQARTSDPVSTQITVVPLIQPPVASFAYSPSLIKVNVTVTFNASASYDPDGTIVSYAWDFGDGNMTTVATPIITHTYNVTGNYTVALNVTDNDGLSDVFTVGITVWPTQIPPFAYFVYSPPAIPVNSTVTFDASGSYDLDGNITQYMWDFGDTNTTTVTTPIITHIYTAVGNYTVMLNVTDNEGLFSIFSRNITVRVLIPPVANFTYSPSLPSVDYPVAFDASASSDEDGTIVLYMWDFGDDTTASTADPEIDHIYTATGNYTVELTVIDNDGLNDSMTTQITVLPAIPWLEIQPARRLVLSEEFEIDIAIKHLAVDWRLFGIQFNLAYDTSLLKVVSASSGPFFESFPWTTSAPYTYVFIYPKSTYVTVVVGLLDGGAEPPGYVYPNGEGVVVRVRFKTTNNVEMHTSYPISFTISNVIFGNVNAQEIPSYPSKGASYYIRIDPPIPEFNYKPLDPVIGETITFNASASYHTSPFENITIIDYEWNFGDGSKGTGMIATHVYGEPGIYNVTLTVTDNNGNSRSISKLVTISRCYITVNVDVGTIYFRGEIAEFYIQTSIWGKPVDVSTITAKLYSRGTLQLDLTPLVTHVDTGLYRINYTISPTASTGIWLLTVEANYFTLTGTNIKSFQISSTLTSWDAQLTSINNGIATIQTDVGTIRINLTDLKAEIVSIENGMATVSTTLGNVTARLSAINATVIDIQKGLVTVSTTLGNVITTLTGINATIIDIHDGIATLSTDLGEVKVSVNQLGIDTTEVKNRLPIDTGTIITILYVATILAAVSAILLFYGLFKGRKSP